MNDFFELMSHPITIIATILALFFVLMAVFRHSNKRKNTPEAEGAADPDVYKRQLSWSMAAEACISS